MWSGHVDEGVKLHDQAIAMIIDQRGADHPELGTVYSNYAASLLAVGRGSQALEIAQRAMKILDHSHEPDAVLDPIRTNLAAVLLDSGRNDEAAALFVRARAGYVARLGEHTTMVANIDQNLAVIYLDAGDTRRAVATLEQALTTTEQLIGGDRIEIADVLYNLAAARRKAGDLAGALAATTRASTIYHTYAAGSDRHRSSLTMIATIDNMLGDHEARLPQPRPSSGSPSRPRTRSRPHGRSSSVPAR